MGSGPFPVPPLEDVLIASGQRGITIPWDTEIIQILFLREAADPILSEEEADTISNLSTSAPIGDH